MQLDLATLIAGIREKRERLAQLQRDADALRAELRQIEAAVTGRTDRTHPEKPKAKSRHGFTGGKRAKPIQEGSSVGRTLALLRQVGRPMSADDILTALNAQGHPGQVQKPTLVSNLSRYVQHHDTFTRPAPNTYGLTEFNKSDAEMREELGFFSEGSVD